AVQLAQDVVGNVLGRARLAVQIDGDIGVAKAQFANKRTQVLDGAGHVLRGVLVELFIVDRQDERAGAALLLGERAEIAVAGDTDHLDTFGLDGGCQRTNPQARGVLGTIVFVDDENGEAEFHAGAPGRGKTEASVLRVSGRRWTNCRPATGGN